MASKEVFKEIVDYTKELAPLKDSRTDTFENSEKIFLMDDTSLPSGEDVIVTLSPDGRNALLGANRLLSATTPKFHVPYQENNVEAQKSSSYLEKAATAVWAAASRVYQRPLELDLTQASLLYSEGHIVVKNMAEMLKLVQGPAEKIRLENVSKRAPIMFEILSPRDCYAVIDGMGVKCHWTKKNTFLSDIEAIWGRDKLQKLVGDKKRTDKVTLNEYWDHAYWAVWVEENTKDPIHFVEHKLGLLPIASQVVEGGNLFAWDPKYTRQPFLYTLWKSGLWNRENLSLTALYTLIFGIAANPQYVYEHIGDNPSLRIDRSIKGGLINIKVGEKLSALAENVIDPSIIAGLERAEAKVSESTIYRQALGEPLGANAPFSMVAMLSQSGRLPLVPYQKMCSYVVGSAMEIALRMLKNSKINLDVVGEKGIFKLEAEKIPDNFNITANLEVSMPQDERLNAMIASQATAGERPLVSRRHARERWLGIEQSDEMDKEIEEQRSYDIEAQKNAMIQLAEAEMEIMKKRAELMKQLQSDTGGMDYNLMGSPTIPGAQGRAMGANPMEMMNPMGQGQQTGTLPQGGVMRDQGAELRASQGAPGAGGVPVAPLQEALPPEGSEGMM